MEWLEHGGGRSAFPSRPLNDQSPVCVLCREAHLGLGDAGSSDLEKTTQYSFPTSKLRPQNSTHVKYGFGTAFAPPVALGLTLNDQPVIAMPTDFIEIKNVALTSSVTASPSWALNSNIVVTTSGDNVTIDIGFICKTVFHPKSD